MDQTPEPLANQPADSPAHSSIPVDVGAMVFVMSRGCSVPAHLVELGIDACKVSSEYHLSTGPTARVEVAFKINGIAVRLLGTAVDAGHHETVIHFGEMADRRKDQLVDLIAEIQVQLAAKADKEAQEDKEAAEATISGPEDEGLRPQPEIVAKTSPQSQPPPPTSKVETSPRPADRHQPTSAPTAPYPTLPMVLPDIAATPAPALPGKVSSGATLAFVPHSKDQPRDRHGRVIDNQDRHHQVAAAPVHQERRMHSRHTVDTQAFIYLVNVSSRLSGRVLDVSLTGCRIRTDEVFPVGIYRRVEAEFILDGLPFRIPGVTQNIIDKYTVGIRFLDVSKRKHEHLCEVIEEIGELRGEGSF